MNNLLRLFEIPNSLSNVQRYSQVKLSLPENVLEHSGFVCLTSYIIGLRLKQEGFEINLETLLTKAICHDLDEAITGDIARPVKYFSGELRNLISEMEDKSVMVIDKKLLSDGEIYSTWKHSKNNSVEGYIVSLCDTLAVVNKYNDELERGNARIKSILIDPSQIINSIVSKIDCINEHHHEAELKLIESQFLKEILNDAIEILKGD